MAETPRVSEELGRLRAVFRRTIDVELHDTDVADLAGLDVETCRIFLRVLAEMGAIERPRGGISVCRPSSWWTSASVRPSAQDGA